MNRLKLLTGALALAIPSFALAQGDPSNPGGVAVAPSAGSANQPQQGELLPAGRAPDVRDPATPAPTAADRAPADADADRIAREAAARPKLVRSVRMGERTMAIASREEVASR